MLLVKRIVTISIRGIKSTDREYRETLDHGNLVFPMERVHDNGIATIVSVRQHFHALPSALG